MWGVGSTVPYATRSRLCSTLISVWSVSCSRRMRRSLTAAWWTLLNKNEKNWQKIKRAESCSDSHLFTTECSPFSPREPGIPASFLSVAPYWWHHLGKDRLTHWKKGKEVKFSSSSSVPHAGLLFPFLGRLDPVKPCPNRSLHTFFPSFPLVLNKKGRK